MAPPWRAIYVTDKERKQSFAEAIKTYDLMVRVYEELGYETWSCLNARRKNALILYSRTLGERTCFTS